MKFKSGIYHRKSIRLPGYDYSQSGIYFVTVCCYKKQNFFGDIKDQKMLLSPIGEIAEQCWLEIPQHFHDVKLDKYVIMPNHIHGLIKIVNNRQNVMAHDVGAQYVVPLHNINKPTQNKFQHIIHQSLGVIIRGYKSIVTKLYRQNNVEYRIWQRNYYEHIIRDENEFNRIREYIKNNPINWPTDRNNPTT